VYLLAGLLSFGVSRNAAAQAANGVETADLSGIETVSVTAYLAKEPTIAPAAKRETRSSAPSADAVWIPGYWDLQADRATARRAGWVWVAGRWARPPVASARWDPAHWGWNNEWWSWIPGHWVQRERHGYPASLQPDQMTRLETSAPPP